MISDIFGNLLSWPFVIGLVAGFTLHRCYAHMKASWLNRHQPLPGGRKHHAEGVDPRRLASVIAIGVIVYSLVQVQATAHRTDAIIADARQFSVQVQECQQRLIEAIIANRAITAENDELSQQQRRIVFDWIHDLIFPPQPYASMTTDDPRRQSYGLALTINTDRVFRASLDRQDVLQKQRDEHPLPDPQCGR